MKLPVLLAVFLLSSPLARVSAATPFLRGDANRDAVLDVSDPVRIIFYLIEMVPATQPLDALDANDDGTINLADVLFDLNFIFLFGPPPAEPFPIAGFDPTPTDPYTEGDEPRPGSDDTPRPDLAVKALAFDDDQVLQITFTNEGAAVVPEGQGVLSVAVDGQTVRQYALSELEDQSFVSPGVTQTLQTDVRLAGHDRYVGAFIDADDEISELNEFQNTVTRAVRLPVPDGADLVIADLLLDDQRQLQLVIENIGAEDLPPGLEVDLEVSVGGQIGSAFTLTLPGVAGGESVTIHPDPAVVVSSGQRVHVVLKTELLAEIDNTNNQREETLPDGSSLSLYEALLAAPAIGRTIIWQGTRGVHDYTQWTSEEKDDLREAILSLEQGGPYPLASPPELLPGNAISAADAWSIYLAHVAQCLHVEVHGLVNWSLLGFSDGQLAYLLDGRQLLLYSASVDRYLFYTTLMGRVTAWNPRVAYGFLSSMGRIKPTQLGTILSLTDWMRAHLIHTAGNDIFTELFDYAGPPPVDKVLYALEGRRHKTAGCWGTSGLYAAVLRAVNIPVRRTNLNLNNASHSRPEFLSVDRSMPHGDDPYNAVLLPSGAAVPSSELLYTLEEMEALFINPDRDCNETICNTVGEQASFQSGQHHWALAHAYLSDYLLYQYANYGADYLNDSLVGPRIGGGVKEYAKPYFTEAERAQVILDVEERLRELGDGDIEAGKLAVRIRYGRFSSNR